MSSVWKKGGVGSTAVHSETLQFTMLLYSNHLSVVVYSGIINIIAF